MLTMINAVVDMPMWFVCVMGIGTVFVGLVCLIVICGLVGLVCRNTGKPKEQPAPVPTAAPVQNRQEVIAAVAAAVAEDLGEDVSAIRILSFKQK